MGDVVGRERELGRLREALDAGAAGSGSVVWVEGDPGIGKSHLVAVVAAEAAKLGFAVHGAAARELEVHRPFGVLADALGVSLRAEGDAGALARLLYGDAGGLSTDYSSAGTVQFQASELLFELVRARVEGGPLLLALDDLHWADRASLQFLARFLDDLIALPVTLVLSSRSTPSPELHRLIAGSVGSGATRLRLGPLDDDAVDALAGQMMEARLDDRVSRLVHGCGGNPLLVATLVRALRAEGALEVGADGVAHTQVDSPSPWLRSAVIAWLSHFEVVTQEALTMASVLGSTFSLTDLALLTGRSGASLWATLRDAINAGVLDADGEHLSFAHDVVYEVLYGELPPAARQTMHREFARALVAADAPSSRVSEHLVRGARPGDQEAVDWLQRAGVQAAPRAPGIAVQLLEAALGLIEAHAPERREIEVRLAYSQVASGLLVEAETLCRQVLDHDTDNQFEGTIRLCLTDALMRQGRVPEVIEQAAATAGLARLSDRDRARAQAWLLTGPFFARDLAALDPAAVAARAAAESADHPGALVHVLAIQGLAASFSGEIARANELAAEASSVALGADTTEAHEAAPLVNQSLALVDADRFEDARRVLDNGRRTFERLGMWPALAMVPMYAGNLAMAAGEWDDALAEYETAIDLAARSGTGWQVDPLVSSVILLVRRGELDRAEEYLVRARAHIAAGAFAFRLGSTEHAEALVAEARGERGAALAALREAWQLVSVAPMLAQQPWLAHDLLRLLVAERDQDAIREVATALDALQQRNPDLASLEALAGQSAAMADVDADALSVAAALPTPRPHDRAAANAAAATALSRLGRSEEAHTHAEVAFAGYELLGAVHEADRLRAVMSSSGVRRSARRVRSRPTIGWESLTASERRVAGLAGTGLSNPEIAAQLVVSRYTVATHVSHVLAKLGLRSRVELAGLVARREHGDG
jgi:DNA-binding NarL/FixJ family response regulator/tetratricopeptide (TPR) repeat protein